MFNRTNDGPLSPWERARVRVYASRTMHHSNTANHSNYPFTHPKLRFTASCHCA